MRVLLCSIILAILVTRTGAQTTQPTDGPSLEVRAQSAFNRGDWAAAIPLLQELKTKYASIQPERVGAMEEQIRLAERSLATGAPAAPEVAVSPEKRRPHPKPATDATYETSIKELGNFEYDQTEGGDIPDDVKGLSGSKLRLKGFMIPMDQAESITTFAMVPDLFACCFGQPPQIQHTLVAKTPKGKAVSYYPDEIIVEGTLKVEEKKEDGFIISVFEVDVLSVRPAAK